MRDGSKKNRPRLLYLTRDELMRHQAAGITTVSFPPTIRLGGVDCAATYLHEPGDARDGLTVTVPLFVLNQVSEERSEWLVTGMLKDKIQALLKSLPQRPRSRLVPLPESATRLAGEMSASEAFGAGSLTDALLKKVRDITSLDVKRADFKLDMLPPHLFMNLRVVDEHGRQLGMGRNLGALKAELGAQARGAFPGADGLNVKKAPEAKAPVAPPGQPQVAAKAKSPEPSLPAGQRYAAWTFGELPELMEVRRGAQSLIGLPALVNDGHPDGVTIEVFDEPAVAAAKHRAGLRRRVALQLQDALKYHEKNIPDLQKMAVQFMPLGTVEELRAQIIDVALDRAFLQEPLPTDEFAFKRRIEEGRGRLTLIANEVARLAGVILTEYAAAAQDQGHEDPARFGAGRGATVAAPRRQALHRRHAMAWLSTLRYLKKAITARLDKLRADPARDAARLAEFRPQEQRYWRLVAERKGAADDRMLEFRWLLEELRVSLFAQELRTPQPVSVKRLDKAWAQLNT